MFNHATLKVAVCAKALAGATAAAIAARTRSAPARAHTFSDMGSLSLSSARLARTQSRGSLGCCDFPLVAGRRLIGKWGATAVFSEMRKSPKRFLLSSWTSSVINRRFRHPDHRFEIAVRLVRTPTGCPELQRSRLREYRDG